MNRSAHARGFTLIELLVAVAITAILASLASPSFLEPLRKARRSEAFALLASAQHAQERWRSQSPHYASDLSAIAPAGRQVASAGLYELAIDAADAHGFAITASARPDTTQARDGPCARLRIRVSGGFVFHGSAALGQASFDESAGNPCWRP